MAFTSINPVVVGDATKASHYSTVFDNTLELRAGGVAIASQAANEIIFATSATQLGRSSSFTFNGTAFAVGTVGPHTFVAGTSGGVEVKVQNTTSAAGAYTGFRLGNNASIDRFGMLAFSGAFSSSGAQLADGLTVFSSGANGVQLAAFDAAGFIRFYTGGSSSIRALFDAAGAFQLRAGLLREFRSATTNTSDSNQTYTAAQLLGGIIVRSGISVTRTDAVDTAANIVAAIPSAFVGLSFEVDVFNEDDSSSIDISGASSGITYVGQVSYVAKAACTLRIVLTNVGGGTEAATVYRKP